MGCQTIIFFAGSIARSTKRRYLSYSEADFEDFRPSGATRCTDWGESWPGGGDPKVPLLQAKFHSIGATVRVYGPQKLNFY